MLAHRLRMAHDAKRPDPRTSGCAAAGAVGQLSRLAVGRASGLALVPVLALALTLPTGGARADAIDGDWCYATMNLNIQGPRIRTPSGVEMQGDYTRHSFAYVAPAAEPGAGTPITMQLYGEDFMQLTRSGAAAPEVWRRCKPVS